MVGSISPVWFGSDQAASLLMSYFSDRACPWTIPRETFLAQREKQTKHQTNNQTNEQRNKQANKQANKHTNNQKNEAGEAPPPAAVGTEGGCDALRSAAVARGRRTRGEAK